MKRQQVAIEALADWDNLFRALRKAARGKRRRPDVQRFLADHEHRLARLREQLLTGRLPLDRYRCFRIRDPKPRDIVAVSFELRVLHHAIMNLIGPNLERSQIHNSYACLPGRGVHAAVRQVQRQLRRASWYVKIDIEKYFETIDHARLNEKLARRFKGRDFLALLADIIGSYQTRSGRGVPIGSLTSQYFANFYLEGVDREIERLPGVRGYVRYMDDMIWFCDSREDARGSLRQVVSWIGEEGLTVKPQRQVQPCHKGVSYCGFRIQPHRILLSRRKQRAYPRHLGHWQSQWLHGRIDGLQLQQAHDAIHALTLPARSLGFRRTVLARLPGVDA